MIDYSQSTPLLPATVQFPTRNHVYHCDALVLLAALPDDSVDFVFTDPPYGHNNNDGDLISKREAALGKGPAKDTRPILNDGPEADELVRQVMVELGRILKPGACCAICCGGGGPDPMFARWSLWLDELVGFKQAVVWDKGPMGMGWHYRRSYEFVLVGEKPGAACKWYDETKRIENIIRPGRGAPKIIPGESEHPTAKPVGLAKYFIRLHTEPGDVVIDPFGGGGSTFLAARELRRDFLGCDLDSQWVQYSRAQLALPFTAEMFVTSPGGINAKQPSLFSSAA